MMGNHPVRNGLIAGGLLIVLSLSFYFTDKGMLLQLSGLLEFGLVVYFMYRSVSATKKDMNGFISFGEAFKPAWLTYILATTIVTLFTFFLMNYVDPGLKDQVKDMQIQAFEQASAWFKIPEAEQSAYIDRIRDTDAYGIQSIAFTLPFSFLFPGVFFALIMAIIMKKEQTLPLT